MTTAADAGLPGPAGQAVRVVAAKWPDLPHWEYDGVLLGEDEHGTWVGADAGTLMSRPGVSYRARQPQVSLVPRVPGFVATFYAPGGTVPCDVYVDIATASTWSPGRVVAVDLDLDVVRGWSGRVWVDDEDEFADHRVRLGYPPEVVHLALTSCARLRAAVEAGEAPFDRVAADRWLDVLAARERS